MKAVFQNKTVKVTNGPFTYRTHRLTGWLDGKRIREQFREKAEAEGSTVPRWPSHTVSRRATLRPKPPLIAPVAAVSSPDGGTSC